MPPNIHFDHSSNVCFNTALQPLGALKAGQPTDVQISLLNDGTDAGDTTVHLYYCGPTAGSPGGVQRPLLAPHDLTIPGGASEIAIPVSAVGGGMPGTGTQTVAWTPDSGDFTSGTATSFHGCLFAQAVVLPGAGGYTGDTTALGNWDPAYPLCAQHNVDVLTIAPPGPSPKPKPIHYAFGIGHGLPKGLKAQLRIERLAPDYPGLVEYVRPVLKRLDGPKPAQALMAADAGATLGLERLWAPKTPAPARRGLRLGHMGPVTRETADGLAAGRRAGLLKLDLEPGELRQGIVGITPPRGAKPGDFFVVGIVNEAAAAPPRAGKARRPRVLGVLTLIVRFA
jgi:hypothetical protein